MVMTAIIVMTKSAVHQDDYRKVQYSKSTVKVQYSKSAVHVQYIVMVQYSKFTQVSSNVYPMVQPDQF